MSFSLFSVVIIFLFAMILAIEIYRGIHKGVRQAMISLASGIASVIISVMLSPLVSKLITGLVFRFIIRRISMYQRLLEMFASADVLAQALVSILLSTFLFVGMFFLLRAAFELIAEIICTFTQKRNNGTVGTRIEKNSFFDQYNQVLGGIAGAISAVLIMMVITSPIMGTFDVANRIISTVERANTKIVNRIGEKNVVAIKTFSKDISGTVFYQLGGKYMYQSAACTYMYGQQVGLIEELEAVDRTVEDGMSLYRAMKNSKSGTAERVGYINELCEDVEHLNICNGLAAEVASKAAVAWSNGEKFFGISKPRINQLYSPIADDLLDVCSEMDVDDVKPNAVTFLKLFAEMVDSKIIYVKSSDYEQLMTILAQSDLIDNVTAILAENPNMKDVNISSLALTALSTNVTESENFSEEEYHVFADNLAQAINNIHKKGYGTEQEKVSALASLAMKYTEDYGVSISSDMATLAAQELLRAVPPTEEGVTVDRIKELISEYAS